MEKELICIVCPTGCILKIKAPPNTGLESPPNTVITAADISGYKCKRGLEYGVNECNNPVRTLTTTVKLACHRKDSKHKNQSDSYRIYIMVPVKSQKPLPKGLLFECMKVISNTTVNAPLKVGDIVIHNILDTGVDIISTANISGEEKV